MLGLDYCCYYYSQQIAKRSNRRNIFLPHALSCHNIHSPTYNVKDITLRPAPIRQVVNVYHEYVITMYSLIYCVLLLLYYAY